MKKNGLFNNIIYILRYAWQFDKTIVFAIFAAYGLCNILYALFETSFIILFIKKIKDTHSSLKDTCGLVVIAVGIYILGLLIEEVVTTYATSSVLKITGEFQHVILKKSVQIDMINYDNPEFYDDFVVASSQAEEMVASAIIACGYILGALCSVATICLVVVTIKPIISIIAFLGFIINMITRLYIIQLEYEYDVKNKRIMRKADYSKRVFYQPEYVKEIKLSDFHDPLIKQFDEAIHEAEKAACKYGKKIKTLSLINWITVYTFFSYFITPMYLGYHALKKKDMDLGEVAGMNSAHNSMRESFNGFNYAIVAVLNVGKFSSCFKRFMEYEVGIEGENDGIKCSDLNGTISVKHVSFKYSNEKENILNDINMDINNGEKIALVGFNGAGKTTFTKLLLRLYDCTDGEILIGGNNIKKYDVRNYRNKFGIVFQNFQIYAASVAENVMMGPVKEADYEKIWEALRIVGLEDKIRKLPKQLDTSITKEFDQNGVLLSGGECQRLAIARILAKKDEYKIFIMDEPSSALDVRAEYTLNKIIMNELKNKTVVFVSHRLSTTKDVDCIYLFNNGKISESGTHEKLINKNGVYAQMFKKQAAYYGGI